ncbi:stage II sporulation protein M [Halogeometricum limi]|uniref:Uncharacterized membrane protein SpoIIM, required for sporulation n=1 Tax=Halogeometricum limi TaxID=555875 RepID=A0A1I6FRL9_9EURY|nr:stage II sporulation protein M [Halogeometricum limi]SFR32546.1 Uncharacterized membrane protein SpoIIM, required for sporulation [Halogeometricum limi]
MNVSTALRAGVRLLSEYSALVLPVALLAAGLVGVSRVPLVVAGLAAFAFVSADGRLGTLLRELQAVDPSVLDGDFGEPGVGGSGPVDPGSVGPESLPPGLTDAVTALLTPEVLFLVGGGGLASLVLGFVLSPLATAARLHTVVGLLRDEDGVRAAILGAPRDWRSLLGVRVLFVGALLVALAPTLAGAALVPVSNVLGIVGFLLGGLVSFVLATAVLLLFAFAGPAVVVDDASAFDAVERSARFPFRRTEAFLGYVAVVFGVLVAAGAVNALVAVGGAARVGSLVGILLVTPVLDGFATALYAERDLPPRATPALADRLREAFLGGLRALGAFVRGHPIANAASAALFAAGLVGGWAATAPVGTRLPIRGEIGAVFGSFPVATFANLAANNWLVAADLAYGGVAAGVPTVVNLLLNGVVVGALGGVFDPVTFAALVVPHGILEVPAIVFGGGLGLWLGSVGLRAVRGRTSATGVAAAIRQAYRVLLGLVPLFVVAAFVEAFLTPLVASLIVG